MESNTGGKVQYAFRRPRFPIIYAVGNELLAALSSASFQRQLERLEPQGAKVRDMVDATGEGWAFHSDLMIVSPLTLKKRWKKIDVIRLFNASDNARRIGAAYPEAYIPRRPLVRIIAEVAALVAYAKPNKAASADRSLRCSPRPLSASVGQTARAPDDEAPETMAMSPIVIKLTAIVALLLLATPLTVEAQQAGQAVQTVGVLTPQRLEQQAGYPTFLETLRLLGYQEGSNLRMLLRSADGKLDRLPALAADLVAARPDVIVALNTPGARAAIQATKQIPIVMTSVGDPVGSGFVSNLARPGGNVTGISNMVAELSSKRLALLKEAVPGAKRIAVMFNPDDPVTVPQLRDAERAASVLKIAIRFFPVRAIGNLPETFKQMLAWRSDGALWTLGQQQAFQTGSIELAASHRLPLMVASRLNVEAGGLISYSFDPVEQYRRTAISVDRILKGAKPGDLPVEQPTKFELTINLKTANALGLAIPPPLLTRADRVVE